MKLKQHTQAFEIKPVPKERPRSTRNGHTYTPKRTKDFEAEVREAYNGPMFEGPIEFLAWINDSGFEVTVREVNWPVRSKLRGDLDNYLKSITDALQGVAYENDKQIVSIQGDKI